jgi:Phage small terminase subunit
MNLAREHRQRTLARQAAEAAVDFTSTVAEAGASGGAPAAARLMLMKLVEDRRRLKEIQSIERKAEAKRQMLPDYEAWVDGLLTSADSLPMGERNDVLTCVMMWHIDGGEIARALDIAGPVLHAKIPLPSWYDRTPATAIAEDIAEAAFAAIRAKQPFDYDLIERAMALTADEDMPDQVRAKLSKSHAQLIARLAALKTARFSAQRALDLDKNSGVKKLIESLDRDLKKLEQPDVSGVATP